MKAIKFSNFSILTLQLWAACFVLLTVHAWYFLSREAFLTAGLAYPLLLFVGVGLFTWFRKPEKFEPGIKVAHAIDIVFTTIPVVFTIYACAVAQLGGNYEEVTWIGIVLGGILGERTARLARMRRATGRGAA